MSAIVYVYCETVTAGPLAPWHIRAKGAGEPCVSYGKPATKSLCGRDLGWDIPYAEFRGVQEFVCQRCAAVYVGDDSDEEGATA